MEAGQNGNVYYIDGEELSEFLKSESPTTVGMAYEWENEGVVHIHFHALEHGFGKVSTVSIVKEGVTSLEDAPLKAIVHIDGTVTVDGVGAEIIPSRENLYLRNKGLLELDILADKRVLIIGIGSGGSAVALNLAKAGVGSFAIMDFDRVEHHNLSRHICCVNDLGRLKTDAVCDAIKGKNPYAVVDKFPVDVTKEPQLLAEQIEKADIVLACTDNNRSLCMISEMTVKRGKTTVFGRCITRAEGGDVFIYRPGQACYLCLLGNDWYDQSDREIRDIAKARREGLIPAYVSDTDKDALVQVGLNADIEPIVNFIVKLALMELSRGTNSGISSLEEEFKENYYIWANRRERNYKSWGVFHNTEGLPTIMRWYGMTIGKRDNCTICGSGNLLKNCDNVLKEALESLSRMGIYPNCSESDTNVGPVLPKLGKSS